MSGFWRGVYWEVRDPTGEERELHRLRAQVAAVRKLHVLDERKARWGHDVCAGCATHVTFTPWPCKTLQALDAAAGEETP